MKTTNKQYTAPKTIEKLEFSASVEFKQQEVRKELISLQSDDILNTLNMYKNMMHNANPGRLTETLTASHYKPEAYEAILDNIKQHFPLHYYKAVENAYLDEKVGYVKHRPITYQGEKPDGITDGALVKKISKNNRDSNILKHKNTWLKKNGGEDGGYKGEEICEYIGTNLSNLIMGENSPKLRLYRASNGSVSLMSKFIPNFTTLRNIPSRERNERIKKSNGFANFFIANVLIGDYDFHSGNVGIREDKDGNSYIARIDNGRALSYYIKRDFLLNTKSTVTAPRTATDIRNTMLGVSGMYSSNLFQGIDFAADLYQSSSNIDIPRMRKVIRLCLDNLREAYGNDFLNNEDIKKQLTQRLGISEKTPLQEEQIEDVIIENIERLQYELQEMAIIEMAIIFPSHPMDTIGAYIAAKGEDNQVNYDKFFEILKERVIEFDITNPAHFNEQKVNSENLEFIDAINIILYKKYIKDPLSDGDSHTTFESIIDDSSPKKSFKHKLEEQRSQKNSSNKTRRLD